MALPLIHRPPTANEVERLRLILSTFQDGTGMLQLGGDFTLPGWRDFERATALAFKGQAQESKAIFDVLLPDEEREGIFYGLSCKMRSELNRISRDGRVTIEVSNSAGQFWKGLQVRGLNQGNYKNSPGDAGTSLIETVNGWHDVVSTDRGGAIDIHNSYYLVLSWNKTGDYQLHQFSLILPDADEITWSFPVLGRGAAPETVGRRLAGNDGNGNLFEWYGESGGQLKYYPLAANAVWSSDVFRLEPLGNIEYGIINKAKAYFPKKWKRVQED